MKSQHSAGHLSQRDKLSLDYIHILKNLGPVIGLKFSEEDEVCNGPERVIDLMHHRTRIAARHREPFTGVKGLLTLVQSLSKALHGFCRIHQATHPTQPPTPDGHLIFLNAARSHELYAGCCERVEVMEEYCRSRR